MFAPITKYVCCCCLELLSKSEFPVFTMYAELVCVAGCQSSPWALEVLPGYYTNNFFRNIILTMRFLYRFLPFFFGEKNNYSFCFLPDYVRSTSYIFHAAEMILRMICFQFWDDQSNANYSVMDVMVGRSVSVGSRVECATACSTTGRGAGWPAQRTLS